MKVLIDTNVVLDVHKVLIVSLPVMPLITRAVIFPV